MYRTAKCRRELTIPKPVVSGAHNGDTTRMHMYLRRYVGVDVGRARVTITAGKRNEFEPPACRRNRSRDYRVPPCPWAAREGDEM